MSATTSIYAGGAFAHGGEPAVNTLLAAGYDTLLVWSVHVDSDGTLVLNNDQIVKNKVYSDNGMDLAQRIATLRGKGMSVGFSVGSGGTSDFANISALLGGGVPTKGNALYDNFAALLTAMQGVSGGGVDFIDFDCEDISGQQLSDTIKNFALMLGDVGYPNVTFCPSFSSEAPYWESALAGIVQKNGASFVSALNVQFYSGGYRNTLSTWANVIKKAGSSAALIPGLSTNNAENGPWWYHGAVGQTVVKTPNVAQYGGGDWSGLVARANYGTVDEALQAAGTEASFMFYTREYMYLGPDKVFNPGDAVYFMGALRWGSAPQCDGYALSGPTISAPNPPGVGGCPSDFQTQYATWKTDPDAPQGGFVWLFDSILSTELTASCGGSETEPVATAKAYREAISNGLG